MLIHPPTKSSPQTLRHKLLRLSLDAGCINEVRRLDYPAADPAV